MTRYSYQRDRILETVRSSHAHPTALMVYDALKDELPKLSLGTVYRNLNLLSELGELKKIPLPDGGCRFDGTLRGHSHILCEKCGAVADVPVFEPAALAEHIHEETGFTVTGFDVVMHGLCRACS